MSVTETMKSSSASRAPHDAPSSIQASSRFANLGRFAGAMGLVILISTPLTWLLSGEFGALVTVKLLLGGVLIGLYRAINGHFFARSTGARSATLMAMSSATVALVLGCIGVANYVAYQNPKEFDLTKEGLYTFSEQTKSLLGRLTSDVRVLAFYDSTEPQYEAAKELLTRYQQGSKAVSYELIAPQNRPDLIEQFQITDRGPRIVVLGNGQEARAKEPLEEQVTNAIVRVAEQTSKTIYFLTGHGEGELTDTTAAEGFGALADAVRAEGYDVQPLSLLQPEGLEAAGKVVKLPDANLGKKAGAAKPDDNEALAVPPQVGVIAILGPRSHLLEPEVEALTAFLARGGHLMVFLDPEAESGLVPMLKAWKIEVQKDLLVDVNPLNRLLGLGPAAPMLQPTGNEHPITKDLTTASVMMTARSLQIAQAPAPGVDAIPLLEAGESAWGETNLASEDGSAMKDHNDNTGFLYTAVAATRAVKGVLPTKLSDEARLAVFGDSDWVNNRYLGMQGNSDMVLNAVNWVAAQEEKITIRPNVRAASTLSLSGAQLSQLQFLSMDVLPVLLVAMGLGVVLIRRQR